MGCCVLGIYPIFFIWKKSSSSIVIVVIFIVQFSRQRRNLHNNNKGPFSLSQSLHTNRPVKTKHIKSRGVEENFERGRFAAFLKKFNISRGHSLKFHKKIPIKRGYFQSQRAIGPWPLAFPIPEKDIRPFFMVRGINILSENLICWVVTCKKFKDQCIIHFQLFIQEGSFSQAWVKI